MFCFPINPNGLYLLLPSFILLINHVESTSALAVLPLRLCLNWATFCLVRSDLPGGPLEPVVPSML